MNGESDLLNYENPVPGNACQGSPPEGEPRGVNEELNRCRRDLEEAKSELDGFLYSVSHDFSAPLRAIDGFSGLLLEKYSDRLDEKGRDYLVRLQAASRKINQMVGDLLRISRLSNIEMTIEDVDLSGIARDIADRLGKTDPERGVTFIVGENIRVRGDELVLTLILENLLGNAWKFTGKKEGAVIEFGAVRQGNEQICFVRDNGIGFDMNHTDELFMPFRKLYHGFEYPGSGTGLATVNRIIRRSGGTIRAESEKGKGTTFYFTVGQH